MIRNNSLASCLKHILRSGDGNLGDAARLALAQGDTTASVRLRAAEAALMTGSTPGSSLFGSDGGEVRQLVASQAVRFFSARLVLGMKRASLGELSAYVVQGATGSLVDEGDPTPISTISIAQVSVPRRKAQTAVAATREWLRRPDIETDIENELLLATGRILDSTIGAELIDTNTIAATSDALQDVGELMSEVDLHGSAGDYIFVAPPKVVHKMYKLRQAGVRCFPEVGIGGGSIGQAPLFSCEAFQADSLTLIDASQFIGDIEGFDFDLSNEADYVSSSTPNDGSQQLISAFQSNTRLLRVTVRFGIDRIRSSASAVLQNISWTNS